jgi:hypothetical protein
VKIRLFCAAGALVFSWIIAAQAGRYYVDQNHPGADDGNTGTSDLPWKTITKANQTLVAGDTVCIKAGTYTAYISPANSGTSSKPITYINEGPEAVIISDAVYGIYLDGKSYIVVQGIALCNLDRFLYMRNNSSHNTIAWCTFDSARLTDGRVATWAGSVISGSSQHNWIHHCRFSNYGYYTADDIGCVIDIGSEENRTDSTCYNLIEDSRFFHGGHHVMGVYGKYNVIRNNWFHNEPWSMGTADADRGAVLYGDRNLSFSGYSENGGRTLFEGNRVAHSADPSDNNGASGMSMNSSDNIVRFNTYFNNISAGLSMSLTSSYLQSITGNKVYHNTFFNTGHNPYDPSDHMSCGIGFGIYSGSLIIRDNVLKNNLLFKHRIPFGEYNINTPDRTGILAVQVFENNWDGDSRGNPQFVDADSLPGAPMDSLGPDLHLQALSPCIDSGTYLTVVVSAGGSGTSFEVADAGYFMDGWGISGVSGDQIQLYGTTQRARITGVNYQTNTVTVDKNVTWTQDQGVCLAYEGTAPDLGAFEHGLENSAAPAAATAVSGKRHPSYAIFNMQGRKIGTMMDAELCAQSMFGHQRAVGCFAMAVQGGALIVKKIAVMK